MAFGAKRIYPIDLAVSKAVGVSLPFNGNAVFKPTYTTKEAIKANLINFLLTGQGEKVFNPGFGAGLRKFVFQQISTEGVSEIENYIFDGEKFAPKKGQDDHLCDAFRYALVELDDYCSYQYGANPNEVVAAVKSDLDLFS